jgi:hypothetical protein
MRIQYFGINFMTIIDNFRPLISPLIWGKQGSKYTIQIKYIILFIFIPLIVSAQLSTFNINGYIKYLFTSSKNPGNDNLIHGRINTRWYPTMSISAALEVRLRAYYGDSVEKIPNFASSIKEDYVYDLNAEFWSRKRTLGLGEIDRLYIDYLGDQFEFTLGRQRAAWGTSLVWNVIDLFNPMSFLDFDYEARPGMDAVRLQYFASELSKLDMVVKAGKNKYERGYAGLFSVNYWDYDFYILAAFHNNRKTFGGAWAGDIKGGGFRGEFKISDPPSRGPQTNYPVPFSQLFGGNLTEYDDPVFSGVLSGDYTFTNSFYIHTEMLYNSNGKKNNAGLFWQQINEASMLSPARWSLFQEFSYDITPLIKGDIFAIYNPDDHSSLTAPSVKWSLMTDLELMSILYVTSGASRTEFGGYGSSLFFRLKYSF